MDTFGQLKNLPLRSLWPNEASDFTPWLASNIEVLGTSLGLELELMEREASVGNFSLDLLAKDLGTSKTVIIENQLTQTDHDHLGKLLTYAAGFDASIIIWISETIREEHRQALEWLNQRTDTDTEFFGVVTEILQIDNSKPAYNFKPVVFPNAWQKSKKEKTANSVSPKGEKYRNYFQILIDELREKHKFTAAKAGQPQNWYSFSSGIRGILYAAVLGTGDRARAEIYIDDGDVNRNKYIFDKLKEQSLAFDDKFSDDLVWERLDEKRASRIAVYRDGAIESSDSDLEEIRKWHIDNLLKFKEVFPSEIEAVLSNVDRGYSSRNLSP